LRYVTVEDIDDLVLGAALLGGGGGGDGYVPRQMLLHALRRFGPVPLVRAAELPPAAPVLPVISAGTPSALVETLFGERESHRLRELVERSLPGGNRRCAAVLPVQPGPVNAVVPLVVAAQLGLPCLDADLMPRCFPAIEMSLFTLAGIPPSPVVAVDAWGTCAVFEAAERATASALLRSCLPHMGLVALTSAFRVTAGECAALGLAGGPSRCVRLGRAACAEGPGADAMTEALAGHGAVALFTGMVAELLHRTTGGFPVGVLSIEACDDPSRVMRIDFQNENLVAAEDGVVRATVPDLINLIDTDTGTVMQTVDVVVGQRLRVVGMPVDERWHAQDAIGLVGPAAFGLDIRPVRVGSG